MKIGIAQINPLVGDIAGNARKILAALERARETGCHLAVFSELALVGYPPKDLLLKKSFIRQNLAALDDIAGHCRDVAALVGFVSENATSRGRALYNSAGLCERGRVAAVTHKSLLPTYDVFDETRYFWPGSEVGVVGLHVGGDRHAVGVSICEDLWNDQDLIGRQLYEADPIGQIAAAGAEVLVNLSASPFWMGKHAFRVKLFGKQARIHKLPIVFANQVGGNDELVFDGASAVFDAAGELRAQAKAFEEDFLVHELAGAEPGRMETYPDDMGSVLDALVLGTRDYVNKCGFRSVVVGLSGGIDSAVTAAIAVLALGNDRVLGVAMPSRYSSRHSVEDARALVAALGVDCKVIEIHAMHEATEAALTPFFDGREPDVTEENVQARIRGNVLMSLSNKFGHLVLTTGNKSELAVGYCTLYGDMCGGLAVISDVPKRMVYALAREINRRAGRSVIPESTLTKPPSAELRPDQTDQDSLPPYDALDAILERYVERDESYDQIVAAGFDRDMVADVIRKVDRNEYKRKQAAPGLKVTSRAFGSGRRMPIAAKYT